MAVSVSIDDLVGEIDERRQSPWPQTFPRGWRPCRECSIAVPVREVWCSLCLFERLVLRPERGWHCRECGVLMQGRRSHAVHCSTLCNRRAHHRRTREAARLAGAAVHASAPDALPDCNPLVQPVANGVAHP